MIVKAKDLLHLPVRTKGGTAVGKVSGIEIQTDTGRMETLLVKPSGKLLGSELRVAWNQIVSLSDKEAVIQDATVQATNAQLILEGADV